MGNPTPISWVARPLGWSCPLHLPHHLNHGCILPAGVCDPNLSSNNFVRVSNFHPRETPIRRDLLRLPTYSSTAAHEFVISTVCPSLSSSKRMAHIGQCQLSQLRLTWLSPDELPYRREHMLAKGAFGILNHKADHVRSDGLSKTVCCFFPLHFGNGLTYFWVNPQGPFPILSPSPDDGDGDNTIPPLVPLSPASKL